MKNAKKVSVRKSNPKKNTMHETKVKLLRIANMTTRYRIFYCRCRKCLTKSALSVIEAYASALRSFFSKKNIKFAKQPNLLKALMVKFIFAKLTTEACSIKKPMSGSS